jgi:predicted DNA-binding transcriptional regulator AlpA
MGERMLRAKEAAKKLGLSDRTFRREVARGNIPRGILISEGTVGWRESAIDRVIADREAGRAKTKAEPAAASPN